MGIRRDVYVYNESTGFVVTSVGLAAGARGDDVDLGAPGDKAWKKSVQAGLVLPIELVQDDPVVVRVIVDEDLTDDEEAEWVGRLEAKLELPDGKLALCGGSELLEEGLESAHDYVQVLDVPAGTYRATLLAQLPGLNGEHLFGRAGKKKAEPIGAFFRRTRGKKKFPAWLQAWCVAYPEKDPGHEREWRGRTRPDEGREVLDFVLQLKPLRPRQKAEAPKVGKDGWVGLDAWEVRAPELCPLGLPAKRLLRQRERAPRAPAKVALPDLEGLLAGCELTRLGRVDVPLERLGHVFALAWFATDSSHPELLIEPDVDLDLQLEGAHVVRERGRLRIGLPVTAGKWDALSLVSKLGPVLARLLPGKSVLELRTACPDLGMGERRHGDAGRQRYRGPVTQGVWRIEEGYPRLTQTALREALELAAQARGGAALALHSRKEAQDVHARVMQEDAFLFESNHLTVDGERLVLATPHEALLTMVGQRVFRKRYPTLWSVPDEDEDEDPFADFAAALTKQLAAPASREVLFEGAFSVYRRADLMALETADPDEVQATDAAMTDLGFVHLGDLVCERAGDVVIRGYAQPRDGDTWAVLMVGTLGQGGFDLSTDLASGASLTTTTTPGQEHDMRRKSWKWSFAPDTPIPTLWRAHRERLAKMTKNFGAPVAVTADLAALAQAIDASLVRQFAPPS